MTVQQFDHTARIGGRVVEAAEIRIDREIATTMPASVSGGGGIVKTTGQVTAQDPGVVVGPERQGPWGGSSPWPPKRYQPVELETTLDEGAPSRRLTGRVYRVSGSATSPVRIDVEDRIDDLRQPVRHDPLLSIMPPTGSETDWRRPGLRADYIANYVMRQGRYYSTPRPFGVVRCSMPMQGSLWPETGTLTRATSYPNAGANPTWHRVPWGWAVGGVDATISGSGGNMAGRAVFIGVMAAANHNGSARVDATLGGTILALRVTAGRNLQVDYNGTTVATATPAAGWIRAQLHHDGSTIRLSTDTGWSYSAAHTIPSSAQSEGWTSTRLIANPNSRIGAVMAGFTQATGSGRTHFVDSELNAHIRPGSMLGGISAMPQVAADDGLQLLQEISEATVASMWTDELGHLWWVHPDRLLDQAPAAELTSDADLLDLAWRDTADSVRSTVAVEREAPAISRQRTARVTVWEGPGGSLGPGETLELIATPPARTDWIMVDSNPRQMLVFGLTNSDWGRRGDFLRGIGSWVGGTPMNADGDTAPSVRLAWLDDGSPDPAPDFTYVSMSWGMERIGPAAWKVTQTQGHASSQWIDVVHRLDVIHRQGSGLNTAWSGQRMPIIRARAMIEWNSEEATSTIQGPPEADRLTHRAGPWVGASGAAALANWLAEQVSVPAPVLDGLPIVWRPDLAPGQVVDVREDAVYGVRLRVLITGISETYTAGGSGMTLTGRVVGAWSLRWTYEDLQAQGGTYADLEAQGGTYIDLMRRGLPGDVTYPTPPPAPGSYAALAQYGTYDHLAATGLTYQQLQEDPP